MKEGGHEVLVSARDKDVTHCLLRAWGIPFIDRGKGAFAGSGGDGGMYKFSGKRGRIRAYLRRSGSKLSRYPDSRASGVSGPSRRAQASLSRLKGVFALSGRLLYLVKVVISLLPRVKEFGPDLVMSWSSYHAAVIGRLLGKPVITFEDTENVPVLHLVNRIFSTRMVTPACFEKELGKKHIRFNGYKELASLHPSRFMPLPLPEEVKSPYIILRFVAWRAWHDRGHPGISERMKEVIAKRLEEFGNVYVSSEQPLPGGLERCRMPVDCDRVHSLLAGASLLFGESASMAAEAALLGVPAIFIDNTGRGYTRELERDHRLLFNFGEDDTQVQRALDKAVELLGDSSVPALWRLRRDRMLEGMVDLTAFMVETAYSCAGR